MYILLVGLHLNADKTKILNNNSIDNSYEVKTLSGHILKQVQNFKYLGAYMADSCHDFNTKKGLAWAAVNKLDCIWKSSFNRNLKVKLFRACVESILLYNSETCTVTRSMEIEIDGPYTKLLRRILNLSWRDHVTNKELYGCIPPLSSTIRQRRMRFAGHYIRSADQPVSKLIFRTPNGKIIRGRGLKSYTEIHRT